MHAFISLFPHVHKAVDACVAATASGYLRNPCTLKQKEKKTVCFCCGGVVGSWGVWRVFGGLSNPPHTTIHTRKNTTHRKEHYKSKKTQQQMSAPTLQRAYSLGLFLDVQQKSWSHVAFVARSRAYAAITLIY